jgi:hypothetical protein
VNVLAREDENAGTAEKVVKKWADKVAEKKKIEPKTLDQVVQLQESNREATMIEQQDEERKKPKPKPRQSAFRVIAKFMRIPERYINNKALFVDVISRAFFPASFIVFNFVFWGVYRIGK